MTASGLEAALRALGIACSVEAIDRLAIIIPNDDASLADAHLRGEALRLMRTHGFTHLALEIRAGPAGGAPLRRD